jgi:hypothetical protein
MECMMCRFESISDHYILFGGLSTDSGVDGDLAQKFTKSVSAFYNIITNNSRSFLSIFLREFESLSLSFQRLGEAWLCG